MVMVMGVYSVGKAWQLGRAMSCSSSSTSSTSSWGEYIRQHELCMGSWSQVP